MINRMVQMERVPLLWPILLLAVALRLGIFFAFPATFAFDQTGAIHGSQAYDDYARNLLSTGVYGREPGQPDALIPPLYSYALAAVYGVFGRGSVQVALFHTLLDVLSIMLLYYTGRRLFARGEWVGALGALFYACYPYLIFQNLTLIDTPFFMLLLHAFVYGLVLLRGRERLDRGTWALAVGAGVVLGFSLLARVLLPLLAVLGALWFLLRLDLRQTLLRLLPVALVSVLVVLPWLVRNQAVYGVFVPGALNSGENFYQGNSEYTIPYFRAGYDVQWVPPQPLTASDPRSPEANAERFQWGLDYLRAYPEQIPDLLWVKFLVHWSIDVAPRLNPVEGQVPRLDYQGNVIAEAGADGQLELGGLPPGDPVGAYSQPLFDQIGRTAHRFYWGALLLLGILGAALSLRQWRDVSLLWFVQISMTVMYLIFHPSTRYRVPSDPLLFLFSAYALVWAWEWWWQRKRAAQ
jgi:4-amino-4-deoxy-L-arabinose transferase-like glycosyltransferase